MSEEQKMILDATTNMPKSQLKEILLFIRYLKFKSDDIGAPKELVPKDEEDLARMLSEADADIEKGKDTIELCPIDKKALAEVHFSSKMEPYVDSERNDIK